MTIFDLKATSMKRCKIRPRLLLITNRKSHRRYQMVPKSTTLLDPELTLNWNCHGLLHYTRFSEPTIKMWIKIDHQCRRCSPGILVSSKLSFIRIFAGFAGEGVANECGCWRWLFSLLSLINLPNFHTQLSHTRPQLLHCRMCCTCCCLAAFQLHRNSINRWVWMLIVH